MLHTLEHRVETIIKMVFASDPIYTPIATTKPIEPSIECNVYISRTLRRLQQVSQWLEGIEIDERDENGLILTPNKTEIMEAIQNQSLNKEDVTALIKRLEKVLLHGIDLRAKQIIKQSTDSFERQYHLTQCKNFLMLFSKSKKKQLLQKKLTKLLQKKIKKKKMMSSSSVIIDKIKETHPDSFFSDKEDLKPETQKIESKSITDFFKTSGTIPAQENQNPSLQKNQRSFC